ncbi:MAG: NAD(P)/FAD-dependent oxidoreductase [Actinobacteria bacterium]|nr:NAD(P)/FAD-dependent oxidoreductase [Actinomycetota bacterium]
MSYDAIIIGAGLGGCAAAAALAGGGKKVIVLERMDRVGGRCSSQEREGFKLDMGSHFVVGCEHGAFEEGCRRVGREGVVKWHHVNNMVLKVENSALAFNMEKITVQTEGSDPIKINVAEGMQEMMSLMPRELMTMGLSMMGQMMPMVSAMIAPIAEQFDEVSIKQFMDQYLDWRKMRDILELVQFAAFGTPSWMTATSEMIRTVLGAMEYYKPGINPLELIGYPKGGLISIPQTMCEGIQEKGGEVRLNSNVRKVIIEGGRATGVELEDGEILKASLVISNAGIKETVAELVGEEHFDAEYTETIRKLVPGVSAFCLRAALDTKISDIDGGFGIAKGGLEDYYHKVWDEYLIPDCPPPIMYSIPSNMDPSLAPEGKQLVIAIGALMYESKEEFSKMEPLAMDAVEHVLPGFKDHIMWHDFLNPNTYITFGEYLAPAIGIAQCIGQIGNKRPSSMSPVPGLFYVGGEAGKNISGIATDMCTKVGLACADYILQNVLVTT